MAASKVTLYYNAKMKSHTHEWPHIEKCTRASHAYDHLKAQGLISRCAQKQGRSATDAELRTVHSDAHIDEVKKMTAAAMRDPNNRGLREPDGPGGVYYSPASDAAARLACGCVIDATVSVLKDAESSGSPSRASASSRASTSSFASPSRPSTAPRAFALVRPPGHHAGADDTEGHRAEGFCFYNSVAVAAGVALRDGLAQRIVILDWDVHHGNGTQNLFFDDGRVLYISLHRYGERWYPETGALDEAGVKGGLGYTLNVPWTENGLSDSDYLAAFHLVIVPVLTAFKPDLLLISAGFDAADGDAQGRMLVSPAGFARMAEMLLETVSCPVMAALEGGYNAPVTSECCAAVLRVLLGEKAQEIPSQLLRHATEPTLRAVLDFQKRHWPTLATRKSTLDAFFAEAARTGQAMRVSKRARAAPTRQYEDAVVKKPELSARQKRRAERSAAKAARKAARLEASREDSISSAAAVKAADREVREAKRKVEAAEEALARERKLLRQLEKRAAEARVAAAEQAAAQAADDDSDDASSDESSSASSSSEDDTNGTADPRRTVLWSHKVKCLPGVRVFSQYGADPDELWFRATVTAVHRTDVGQWVDVEYDDGDTEAMKPIKRVRAIDPESSSSEDEDEDED